MTHLKGLGLLAFASLLTLSASAAPITTIDFNTLVGNNQNTTPFTTYSENNFTVNATTGTWQVNVTDNGNPAPSIYAIDGSVTVKKDAGTFFTFLGVDLKESANQTGLYTISGYLGANQVFTTSGNLTTAFQNYGTGFSADDLSSLVISVSHGSSVSGGNFANVDNIRFGAAIPLAATPEPESLTLMLTGAAGVAAVLRRRVGAGLRK